MKRIIFYLLFFTHIIYSQENKTIFDLARTGNVEDIEELLKKNPDAIFNVNESGFSALILATYRKNNEVAKFLIKKGSNINQRSPMGTPLMAAIVKANNEIAEILITNGAELNLNDENGITALIYAVQFKNYFLISLLVRAGAEIENKDKNGKSALDYALLFDDDKMIELLKNKNKKL